MAYRLELLSPEKLGHKMVACLVDYDAALHAEA